jgi:uncharacterized membrane protein
MFLLLPFDATSLSFPGGSQAAFMLMRWIHFVAGILWIGLLYFFVLVNAGFMGELDANTRPMVFAKLMPRAMWWFRWSSVVTVLVGFAYWNHMVASDARSALAMGEPASAGRVIGSFVLIWTVAFAIEMGLVMAPVPALKKAPVLGVLVAIVLIAASYVFLALNEHGWESTRTLSIGIGGGLGWFMMFNVWGIVWRIQKKLIRWNVSASTNATPIPPEAAPLAHISSVVAVISFWVSFPMLFFMGAGSHYLTLAQ